MERNHIIGFGLIFGLLVLWMFVNSPSEEEMAQMKERQDSLNQISLIQDSLPDNRDTTVQSPVKTDSVLLSKEYGSFATSSTGINKTVRLENDHFIVDFDTQGGRVSGVELKNYKKVLVDENKEEYKVPLKLLENKDNIWDISLPAQRGDLHTANLHF